MADSDSHDHLGRLLDHCADVSAGELVAAPDLPRVPIRPEERVLENGQSERVLHLADHKSPVRAVEPEDFKK